MTPTGLLAELDSDAVHAFAQIVALHVVELLEDRATSPQPTGLVDAASLARILGVSRSTVYEHADELGAREVGDGDRPRLRFDVDQAREAWTRRVSGERSQEPRAPAPAGVRRRRRADGSGSGAGLLPVKGQEAA